MHLPIAAFLSAAFLYGEPTSPPACLWQAKEEGFIVRFHPCDGGLCAVGAGVPKSRTKPKREEVCGKPIIRSFAWNGRENRWEGKLSPPGKNMELKATLVSESTGTLTLRGKLLTISKTITLVPFSGSVTADCIAE